jgi:MFS family permease
LFDLELFKNRSFSSGIAAVTALFFAMFGVSFLISQYIQFVRGADVFGVGLRFLPLALGSLVTSNLAARFTRRFGVRPVLLTGMGMVGLGLAVIATLSATSAYLMVGIAFGLIGLGMGLSIAPASNAVISAVPADKVGAGSGLRSMVQLLGGSFGVAIVGSVATSRYRSHVHAAYAGPLHGVPASARPAISDQIGQAFLAARQLPVSLAHTVSAVTDRAFVSGMRVSAIIGVAVVLLSALAVAAYIPREIDDGYADDASEASDREAHAVSI